LRGQTPVTLDQGLTVLYNTSKSLKAAKTVFGEVMRMEDNKTFLLDIERSDYSC